jgi:hypothetical protein
VEDERRRLIKMEKEKRVEAGMRVCVCTNESVSCCGNGLGWLCFQQRISRPRFIGSDDERS